MKILEKLNSMELKNVLKGLKTYSLMKRKLGKRGKSLFKRNLSNKSYLVVEYFPSIEKDIAFNEALKVYDKVFSIKPEKNDIEFKKTNTIKGGIRVYLDDSMVDVSYARIENKLKK